MKVMVTGVQQRPGEAAQQVARRLAELTAEFAGWRFGRGGSGHWWGVRGNDLIRSMDVDELRRQISRIAA